MKKIVTVIILFTVLFQNNTIIAQDILKGNDLSSIRVDNLTDGDIAKIKSQLLNNQISIDRSFGFCKNQCDWDYEFIKRIKKTMARKF